FLPVGAAKVGTFFDSASLSSFFSFFLFPTRSAELAFLSLSLEAGAKVRTFFLSATLSKNFFFFPQSFRPRSASIFGPEALSLKRAAKVRRTSLSASNRQNFFSSPWHPVGASDPLWKGVQR
ncbi:hypothetical protein ACFSC6_22540, partial [Rufibacter sediminis]|uniref:hypothetical protein n=1 Tax=Rufibacter sediminis TaxID=2762756 RepID=UPI003642A4C5